MLVRPGDSIPASFVGGNGKQSVATWLRGMRALMSSAELRGYIELSPFRMWKLKQPKLPAQRGFSADDVRRMIDVAARQPLNAMRDTAILLLLFDTGVRCSEVCRLRLADEIDGDRLTSSVTVHLRVTSTAALRCTHRRSEPSLSTSSTSVRKVCDPRLSSWPADRSMREAGIHSGPAA